MRNGSGGRRAVRVIDYAWITVRGGTRLAARIWLPEDADADPVPGILEAIPYRQGRRHGARATRASIPTSPATATPACASTCAAPASPTGILDDEYLQQEQDDLVEIIAWIAAQPWCTGAVGMMGISWGGFNSLQVAACRPPAAQGDHHALSHRRPLRRRRALHGRLPCMAIDMLALGHLHAALSAPCRPTPRSSASAGARCGSSGSTRTPPWIDTGSPTSAATPTGSTARSARTTAPSRSAVYAVGGWADGYTNAVLRLLEICRGPRKGLIGPWGHCYPHHAAPGPAIGFLQECAALVGPLAEGRRHRRHGRADAARMDAGAGRAAGRHWRRPGPLGRRGDVAGGAHRACVRWRLDADGALADRAAEIDARAPASAAARRPAARRGRRRRSHHPGIQTTAAPTPAPGAERAGPATGRPTSGLRGGSSLCFTSARLAGAVEILGRPLVTLSLAGDQPLALVVARLGRRRPGGASLLVTRGCST